MLTIDDIKALIASDESLTLELKKSTCELKDGIYAACAFLNTEDGWLIFKESHESYPYNRNMAQALYRSTLLESWGSGIHRIIEACRE